MRDFVYKNRKKNEISFPLGGIGTGCVGLSGNGRLIDWEMMNMPNKGDLNGFSHFAVRVEKDGRTVDARIMNGPLPPPYGGSLHTPLESQFGTGPCRETMAGFPHFEDCEFTGEYPFATICFKDGTFPCGIKLTAFNPFIPMDDLNSSVPSAFFECEAHNPTNDSLECVFLFSVSNPAGIGGSAHHYTQGGGYGAIVLGQTAPDRESPGYGELTAATDASDVSYQEYWHRGHWYDELGVYWRDLTRPGRLTNRGYPEEVASQKPDTATLAAHLKLDAKQTRTARFVLSWYYPNFEKYWHRMDNACECGCGCGSAQAPKWKNHYAGIYKDSLEAAVYSLANWDRLHSQTKRFHDALFGSSLPPEVLDAVSANISILKSPTCLRLEDGSFYGFEGCLCDHGCCEGSCTHVWNYAYALPFLFPGLERSMRDLDFRHNMDEDGGMSFRLQLPPGSPKFAFRPCADGQFGGVIKLYRDWQISGDDEWMRSHWPSVKRNISYAWSERNPDNWDRGKTGVLTGRQHHTLDMELFGPNSWLTGFYLCALKAAAGMAKYLGEEETAEEYGEVFERGYKWVRENLFNGEYFFQKIDLKDKGTLAPYAEGEVIFGGDALGAYWSDEFGEMKYQMGDGCAIDQVVAQWHANIIGLGRIFGAAETKKALGSIYKTTSYAAWANARTRAGCSA